MEADTEIINILCCPACKGNLRILKDGLVCMKCKEKYPVKEGIPVLMPKD